MKTTYITQGICSKAIEIELDGDLVGHVTFIGGCKGNTAGISSLVKGMPLQEVITRLKGIPCRGETSCPDQLAIALEEMSLEKIS
jgi:uncharacterized protein (TIGR03905 family)